MNSFSITRKKTPFQKHREEEEAKKKRAEDETARLYAEFVESFRSDTPGSKTFVRGGIVNPNEKVKTDSEGESSKDGVSVPKKGTRYVPSFLPPSSRGREPEKKKEEEKPKDKEKGKPRIIDNFLEELKVEQELREKRNHERDQREGHHPDHSTPSSRFDELPDDFDLNGKFPGSFDDGDPQTTNLYVGNLAPQVDENFLLRTFGRFGPIASVKIMWPRTEEERRRQRNCGFVAFMNRADGQAAKDEMQGVIIYEYELKIGWGKSVALPAQALPAPPPGQMAIRNKDGGTVVLSGPGLQVTSLTGPNSELVLTPNVPDILVIPPQSKHQRHVIDTMALYVLDGRCPFEQAIMERVRGNSVFNFLFELSSEEHTYYVWRLYSFAQGDTLQRWRTEPFIMINGSGRWIPPSLPTAQSPEHVKESSSTYAAGRSRRLEVEQSLTDSQRDEFEDMLRALTLERSQIKDAMGFALDNAEAAGEVVEVLTESLTLKETSIPTKVARLMLVSDILHNSSAPVKNASAYRTKFEANLPDIIESFNDLYCSVTGRITAEALKERVLKVLQVWADWFLFSDAYVNGLRATFIRSGNSGVIPFHSICGDVPEIEGKISTEDISEGGKLNQDTALAMGKGAAMKELLALPLVELERRCRHNGISLVGGREIMVARLLYLEEAEKHGSYEQDDDIRYGQSISAKFSRDDDLHVDNAETKERSLNRKGEENVRVNEGFLLISDSTHPTFPEEASAYSRKYDSVLPGSKWNRDEEDSTEEDKNISRGLSFGYSSSGSESAGPFRADDAEVATDSDIFAHSDGSLSEEHRKKLRRLEVAVLEYRESLEERGVKNLADIERKVASYRRRLQSENDSLGSLEGSDKQLSQRTSEKMNRGEAHNSSRKRHRSKSHSKSPTKKLAAREKDEASRDRDPHRERERSHDTESKRGREKSSRRERDDDPATSDRAREHRRK